MSVKSRNSFAVDTAGIDCDYYHFLKHNPDAVNAYNEEYITQYSWSEQTPGEIQKLVKAREKDNKK